MALIKLASPIAGISGTIGGITYAHNKAGWTAKPWSRSSNPQSEKQQIIRAALTSLPSIWRFLDPSLRADWNSFAASPPETDKNPFGEVVLRDGFVWFIRINLRRAQVGQATDTEVPTSGVLVPPAATAFAVSTPVTDDATARILWPIATFAAGEYAVVKIAYGTGGGVAVMYRDFYFIASMLAAGTLSIDLGFALQAIYGTPTVGNLAVAHVYRQAADGVRSIPTTIKTLITVPLPTPDYTVSGYITPDATGPYFAAGTYNGVPYYSNLTTTFYLWWAPDYGGSSYWLISTALGAAYPSWNKSGTINIPEPIPGAYLPSGTYTGTATIT